MTQGRGIQRRTSIGHIPARPLFNKRAYPIGKLTESERACSQTTPR
jgi:hypothetical protein